MTTRPENIFPVIPMTPRLEALAYQYSPGTLVSYGKDSGEHYTVGLKFGPAAALLTIMPQNLFKQYVIGAESVEVSGGRRVKQEQTKVITLPYDQRPGNLVIVDRHPGIKYEPILGQMAYEGGKAVGQITNIELGVKPFHRHELNFIATSIGNMRVIGLKESCIRGEEFTVTGRGSTLANPCEAFAYRPQSHQLGTVKQWQAAKAG